MRCEIALVGGRVIDPETGLDGIHTVGIAGGRIVSIGPDPRHFQRSLKPRRGAGGAGALGVAPTRIGRRRCAA